MKQKAFSSPPGKKTCVLLANKARNPSRHLEKAKKPATSALAGFHNNAVKGILCDIVNTALENFY